MPLPFPSSLTALHSLPLLGLSPNIRHQIFGYVLGHNSIHVTLRLPPSEYHYLAHESRYTLDLCPHPEILPDDPEESRAQWVSADHSSFVERHVDCCAATFQGVDKALSLYKSDGTTSSIHEHIGWRHTYRTDTAFLGGTLQAQSDTIMYLNILIEEYQCRAMLDDQCLIEWSEVK